MPECTTTRTPSRNGSGASGLAVAAAHLPYCMQLPQIKDCPIKLPTISDTPVTDASSPESGPEANILSGDAEPLANEIRAALAQLTRKLDENGVALQGTQELAEGYRRLADQFYQREVLDPMLFRVIALADRVRDQGHALGHAQRVLAHSGQIGELAPTSLPLELMRAVLTDLHALLAGYGVETYETPSPTFDSATQESVPDTVPADQSLHGFVAERLAPGYRKGPRIFRPERVRIYVHRGGHVASNKEG